MRQCSLAMKSFLCRKLSKEKKLLSYHQEWGLRGRKLLCCADLIVKVLQTLEAMAVFGASALTTVSPRTKNDRVEGRGWIPGGSLLNCLASHRATAGNSVCRGSAKMSFTAFVSLGRRKACMLQTGLTNNICTRKTKPRGSSCSVCLGCKYSTLGNFEESAPPGT